MNKSKLIEKVVTALLAELEAATRAARAAHAEATHEQSKADNKYDTRGLEASYLARGQSRQIAEAEAAIGQFQAMEVRRFTAEDPIAVGALVSLTCSDGLAHYFIGPCAGGTEVVHDGKDILVITPQSPLGTQIVGKRSGESLKLEIAGQRRSYHVERVV